MIPTSPSRTWKRAARTLSAFLCLTTFALGSCSVFSKTPEETKASDDNSPRPTAEAPTIDPINSPTPEAGNGRRTAEAPTIDPSASPTPWTAPSLKFYNEDTSVWYQDDSIANPDAVTDQGNIEGFRTHDGNCQGIEKRDISEKIHDNPLSDDEMSSFLVDVKDGNISDVSETSRETVDRVRDDGGTMDGYSIGWTGTLTSESGESQEVEGYKFARAVGDAGLNFSAMVLCHRGSSITNDQWQTILGGIRIEGLTAGKMK